MNIHLSLTPLISLLAGILILLIPRLLNYIVASAQCEGAQDITGFC